MWVQYIEDSIFGYVMVDLQSLCGLFFIKALILVIINY
jgi:hypothetical protein